MSEWQTNSNSSFALIKRKTFPYGFLYPLERSWNVRNVIYRAFSKTCFSNISVKILMFNILMFKQGLFPFIYMKKAFLFIKYTTTEIFRFVERSVTLMLPGWMPPWSLRWGGGDGEVYPFSYIKKSYYLKKNVLYSIHISFSLLSLSLREKESKRKKTGSLLSYAPKKIFNLKLFLEVLNFPR